MIKLIHKTTILTLLVCCTTLAARAQIGYDYSQYDVGVAGGFNQVYGNAQTQPFSQSVHINFTFNYTPYTNFVWEAQFGKLTGGDSVKTTSGRYFNNDFSAFIFRGQLQLGEIMDYSHSDFKNGAKNLYLSIGMGYIVNYITQINRYSIQVPGLFSGGKNSSNEVFIPLRLGYEFKIFNSYQQPSVKVDLGYEYNYVLGNGVDGFSAPKKDEAYTQLFIGVKFAVGGSIVSYKKQIHY